ncbi:tonB-system energizer ExbB [[Pseudomonas] carboxydohydrogena]|uniref:Biopolymer transport protein ExbB n=2 Tax=Afipia carboxydohydrogena TaxID=290 RepID=A0ABY8BKX2_AFICR|nr:tonB-system energizer ExbB [[Pseudomonas] carboxydohydrogena]
MTCLSIVACLAGAVPVLAQEAAPARPATPAVTSPAPATPSAVTPATAVPAAAAPAPTALPAAEAAKASVVPHDLSPWSMFMSADIVVKLVMIGLAFASLMTWTICFAKMREQFVAQQRLKAALRTVSNSRTLAEARMALGTGKTVLSSFLAMAVHEVRLSSGIVGDAGIKERAASLFAELTRSEARRMRLGMGMLATIGATAPFVGLFGTVWGIMNSFIGISKMQTTNLAVVAPGIAEALLATAMGLVAAIPAVIIYNHFSRVTKRYLELVSQASGTAGRLLSRDLDRGHGAISHAAE